MRKQSYKGIVDQGRTMGFRKSIRREIQESLSRCIKIRVQIFSMGKILKIFADEQKGGYQIGDFIKFDKRGNYDKYKGNEGLSCLIHHKKEVIV
jgi:hypothetical protein